VEEVPTRLGIEFRLPAAQCKAPAYAVVQVEGDVLRLAVQSSEDRVRVSVRSAKCCGCHGAAWI